MNTLRQAVGDYLTMRRNLGFKLLKAGRELPDFVTFMERRRATYVTHALALKWAQIPRRTQPALWASRLTAVRQFALFRSATDSRTQVPASGLLPFRPKRATPHIRTGRSPTFFTRFCISHYRHIVRIHEDACCCRGSTILFSDFSALLAFA